MPVGSYAVDGFTGPTWYDYRDGTLVTEGKGTLLDPIVIETAEQLAQLAYLVNEQGQTFADKVVVLANNIDLTKTVNGQRVQWIPIGQDFFQFEGMFLGIDTRETDASQWKRHSISGMYMNVEPHYPIMLGLFGFVSGFIGHLDITNASVTYTSYGSYSSESQVSILCGQMYNNNSRTYSESASGASFSVPNSIMDVAVNGTITANTPSNVHIGPLSACYDGHSISHCSVKVTINANDRIANCGGICASMIGTMHDCTADISITGGDIGNVGALVGVCSHSPTIEGCTATGSITAGEVYSIGGIVGQTGYGTHISGCASGVALNVGTPHYEGTYTCIGGIAGVLPASKTNPSVIKCCTYASDIQCSHAGAVVGGLCGELDADNGEYITSSLFLGTINSASATAGAIVGNTEEPMASISNSIYDTNLFSGPPAPGCNNHPTVLGLPTAKLTSGNSSDITLLNTDDSENNFFRLNTGFYPQATCNQTPPTYATFQSNTALTSDIARKLFGNQTSVENTVALPAAWLCTVPVTFRNGDCADDFVATVAAPNRSTSWTESGRTVNISADCQFPNTACLSVKDKTATAKTNGLCQLTIATTTRPSQRLFDRPQPISGTRKIGLNATPDQVWSGTTIATTYAAGSGTAEDPYIIKNGAQLARAILNNQEGQFFEQICNITLCEQRHGDNGLVNDNSKRWFDSNLNNVWPLNPNTNWKASYDGGGHFISGALLYKDNLGLFGNITASGSVENLAIIDSHTKKGAGLFAGKMDGRITNCIAQGSATATHNHDDDRNMDYSGGICSIVGYENADARIEDCISAVYSEDQNYTDYTPFVSLSDDNHGKVVNCLTVVPMIHQNVNFQNSGITASGKSYIENCYWLKGYEEANTGYTLEELTQALTARQRWTATPGYFPTLKTFADTDMAKLLIVPFRTDIDYSYSDNEEASDNYLMGFCKHLEFEPGTATWTEVRKKTDGYIEDEYIEMDADMGIIAPKKVSYDPQTISATPAHIRTVSGLRFIVGTLGKFRHFIPVRTSRVSINPGITFKDDNARDACLAAFDSDSDGTLSLTELKAVTNEATLTAFQTSTARAIRRFPEFRFFKSVTTLTSQLRGLTNLEQVSLPYALTTIGSEAFSQCSSLRTVTIPSKLTTVEPCAFYGSSVDNIAVDPFNTTFFARDGLLFQTDGMFYTLVAYPNGRSDEDGVVSGVVDAIAEGAVYKVPGLKRLYFDTEDYNTVTNLIPGGLVTEDEESMLDVYVCDATSDAYLYEGYLYDYTWSDYADADKLHRYYPLKVGNEVTTNITGEKKWTAMMCIGFDTQLPKELMPFVVTEADQDKNLACIKQTVRQIPSVTPLLILADSPGTYRLMPLDEPVQQWPMYQNRLVGTDRNGMPIYQHTSAQGSILSPTTGTDNALRFDYDRRRRIPPYHAYLTYNTVGMSLEQAQRCYYEVELLLNNISLANNGDNTATLDAYDGFLANVSLNGRTLYKDDSWNTLVLPFNLTLADSPLADAEARELSSASFSGSTLTLNFSDPVGGLTAGTPYIIKWTGDGTDNIENPVFNGVTISKAAHDASFAGVSFMGTYNAIPFTAEDKSILFMGANNTLYYPAAGIANPVYPTIGACRAYFKLSDSNEVKGFVLNFGGNDVIGIKDIKDLRDVKDQKDSWFDMNGRKLSGKPTSRGVYINNRRKIVIP